MGWRGPDLPVGNRPAYRWECVTTAARSLERLKVEPEAKRMNHEKVLIVEDEENERSGLAEIVSSWGYRAVSAR